LLDLCKHHRLFGAFKLIHRNVEGLVHRVVEVSPLPTRQMILDIIGDFLADRRQVKQLVLDDRIVGLFGKFPIHHRLIS
jgi:hypothetical protein